ARRASRAGEKAHAPPPHGGSAALPFTTTGSRAVTTTRARLSAAAAALVCALLQGGCDQGGGSTTVRVPAYATGSTVPGFLARRPRSSIGDVWAKGSLVGGTFPERATIPGSTLSFPTSGAADVSAVGAYADGFWIVTMERLLDTADPDRDVRFEPGGTYFF